MCSLSHTHTYTQTDIASESSSQFTMKIFPFVPQTEQFKFTSQSWKESLSISIYLPFDLIEHSCTAAVPLYLCLHFTFSLQFLYKKNTTNIPSFLQNFILVPEKDCCSVLLMLSLRRRSKFVCANTSCLHSTSTTTPPTTYQIPS